MRAFLCVFFVAGCGASIDQLHTMSAAVLECHVSRMTYDEESSERYFVTGCGREATFLERCDRPIGGSNCRWELAATVYPQGTRDRERALAQERLHGTAPDP